MSLDHATNIVKHQTVTRDAFLDGRLRIKQPGKGFRAGLDSVLLGAAAGMDTGTLLDLGAGVGTAALVALVHHTKLNALLVENEPEMLAMAAENVVENGLLGRATAISLDLTATGAIRAKAGLKTDHYDTVIANPPFFTAGQGTLAKGSARAVARHMGASELDLWVKTAAASAAPGGEIIFILPVESLAALLAAFDARFGALTLLPLGPRPGEPASRILLRGINGSRAPLTLLPSRSFHAGEGNAFAPEFESILRGTARLVW